MQIISPLSFFFFFFNDTATTEIYTLSLHDALPISIGRGQPADAAVAEMQRLGLAEADPAHDLDGWDQAVKIVILANVLMGRDLKPADVERTPLAAVDAAWLRRGARARRPPRLGGGGSAGGPARGPPGSPGAREVL